MGLLVNNTHKWAYLHIPKTGGTTITDILLKVPGTQHITSHGTLNDLRNVNDYFIFTFVRNPYTRLTSWYDHIKRDNKSQSFSNFLNNISSLDYLYYPQSYFIKHGETADRKISYVGKYETFDEDLLFILKRLNIEIDTIPHLNKNPMWEIHPNLNSQKMYKFYYTQDWMKEWIRNTYKDDFTLFNYELDV